MKVAKLPKDFIKFAPDTNIPDKTSGIEHNDGGVTEIQESEVKDLESNHVFPETGPIAKKMLKNPEANNIWAEFNFQPLLDKLVNRKDKALTEEEKDRYEWFCAGYLYYYDTILRNEAVDHVIYFQWETAKVTIYMHPAPDYPIDKNYESTTNTLTDPPRPPAPPPPPLNT